MDFYVARQPIFDRQRHVYGYEILFRSSERNEFCGADPTLAASSSILRSLFSTIDVEKVLDGKRAFLNFDRELLLEEMATLLPRDRVVIEVLESVAPDAEVASRLTALKQNGYSIALDDFVSSPDYDALIALAEIVKIDVLATPLEEQRRLVSQYGRQGVHMLAEKIETPAAFEQALDLGYTYFQGYFFARPAMMRGKDLPGLKPVYLRILREVNHPQLDVEKLELILRQDMSLTYRLLRYLSSPLFTVSTKVESLHQALILMGETNLTKWFSLAALAGLGDDKPRELVTSALLRAFFCEALAGAIPGLAGRAPDLFLTGLFSRLDAFLDRPISQAIAEIPLPPDVADALGEGAGPLAAPLAAVCAYEAGDWERVPAIPGLSAIYVKALQSCQEAWQSV